MARYKAEVPVENLRVIKEMERNLEKIFGEMTKAGAEVVANNMRANAPSNISGYVKTSRVYKTPSDGGINTKVYVSGYLPFSNPNRKYFSRRGKSGGKVYSTTKGVPVEFLANLYEYGRSTAPFPKKPFLRKSFGTKAKIEKAMLEAQKRESGGVLE